MFCWFDVFAVGLGLCGCDLDGCLFVCCLIDFRTCGWGWWFGWWGLDLYRSL